MSKQLLLSRITSELDRLNVPYQTGGSADITVSKEFLDAGWSTGNKKITYEASVFADEASNTVYMWELTKEIGRGFSFGESSESYSQTGTTLFRKVKSIQYGPEGKAYEYILDLGAIPKAVKSAAKELGWGFKTVIHKNKASYPAGYIGNAAPVQVRQADTQKNSFCTNCGYEIEASSKFCQKCGLPLSDSAAPRAQEAFPQPNPAFRVSQGTVKAEETEKRAKTGKMTGILISVSSVFILVFFALMGVQMLSWVLAIAVLGVFFLLARKVSSKSTPLTIILWVIAMIAIFVILAVSIPDNDSASDVKPQASASSEETDALSTPDDAQAQEETGMTIEDIAAHALALTRDCWKSDAKIAGIRISFFDADFERLKGFDPAISWDIVFFSPSSNTLLSANLMKDAPDAEGYPGVFYNCTEELADGIRGYSISPEELKASPNAPLDITTPDSYYDAEYAEMPDNMLLDSAMTLSEITALAYEKLITVQNVESFEISVYYVDQMIDTNDEIHSAVWDFSCYANGSTSHFIISPANGKSYEY